MKKETVGVDPKLPIQAIVTILVAVAAYFGIELSEELSVALGVVLGAVAAYFGPAASVQAKRG
jgi:xanthine/uracil permease